MRAGPSLPRLPIPAATRSSGTGRSRGISAEAGSGAGRGVRDIFRNGRLYAFECATAMVICLYRAVGENIGDPLFNRYFADLLLFDWHYDSDLRLITLDTHQESYPGDILYFINPDYSPLTPQWRGRM
ncbi:hypothetical protein N6H14_06555 [Paenibacillus sp. CC-CFT747]|nr:hypothetical protein N6H14_06555 [Paenibacillus sp. CC-CFT747]